MERRGAAGQRVRNVGLLRFGSSACEIRFALAGAEERFACGSRGAAQREGNNRCGSDRWRATDALAQGRAMGYLYPARYDWRAGAAGVSGKFREAGEHAEARNAIVAKGARANRGGGDATLLARSAAAGRYCGAQSARGV